MIITKHPFAVLAITLTLLGLTIYPACSRKAGEPQIFTGSTLGYVDMIAVVPAINLGKVRYAQVNSAWILWAYDDFRSELSAGAYGVTRWSDRSTCTFFASSFEAFCQKRYFAQAFHTKIPADGIAVGTIWYTYSPATDRVAAVGHAVNVIITENGPRYFEPQSGKFVQLNTAQADSIKMCKFD